MRPPHVTVTPYTWSGIYADFRDGGSARHDPGLCADVRAPWMEQNERLILRTCEIIGYPETYVYDDHLPTYDPEGRGRLYQHHPFTWDVPKQPHRLSADCTVPDKGRFTVSLSGEPDVVDIQLSLRNDLDVPIGPIDWAFCVIGLESPSIGDKEHLRTMVCDHGTFRTFRDMTGSGDTWLYQIEGGSGFTPAIHQHLPVNECHPDESLIIVKSRDGRHTAALGFEQSYNAYGSDGNQCFHADPWFGTLAPGEEKTGISSTSSW